jgi:Inosine-uridine preferring nucleoside hydrolase
MGSSSGRIPEGVRQVQEGRRKAAELGAALSGTGLGAYVDQFGPESDWPEDLRDAPIIIDAAISRDPGAALAVAAAARVVPELALVLTDGTRIAGERARFTRRLLDELGRTDVMVVAGEATEDIADSGDGMVSPSVSAQGTDVMDAVRAVRAATPGPVCWIGMGPMTNLSRVVEQAPELAPALRVIHIAVGGHQADLDQRATATVLDAMADHRMSHVEVITSDIAEAPAIAVGRDSDLYRVLTRPGAPGWAGILAAHLDRWFGQSSALVFQGHALGLSAALDLPFVVSADAPVGIDGAGRLNRCTGDGPVARVSMSALYGPFMNWLTRTLDPDVPAQALPRVPGQR